MPSRGAELHQQFLARERCHCRKLLQPCPQPLQFPPPHRPLLRHAITTLRVYIQFPVLRQELHVHTRARFLPRLGKERFLQAAQPSLRRAHHILHRGIASAHLFERLLGRDPSVHHPGASRAAILPLNVRKEAAQRGLVRRVARQHLVGQRQSLRGHHQRNDYLHAIGSAIARVAKPAFVLFRLRRIALKIRARQVIQQHVERRVEQIPPPTH